MRLRLVLALLAISGVALVASGCGQKQAPAGAVPPSAAAAPADTLAFVSVDTDLGSDQWQNAQALVDLFPSLREKLTEEIDEALEKEGVSWKDDIEPGLGPEIVVVAMTESQVVALLQPRDSVKLDKLLAIDDEPLVKRAVGDWTAVAEDQGDIDAYVAALGRGTLDTVDTFTTAWGRLPDQALVKGWVDGARLTKELQGLADRAGELGAALSADGKNAGLDLGLDSIAFALAARADGPFLSVDVRGPELGNGTEYEPRLFTHVPGDAVAALSFGGTQGVVDRVRGPLEDLSDMVDSAIGVSLDRVLRAFSGEGVLYVRRGTGDLPEVSLVLAPPDVDEAFGTIDTMMRKLAAEADGTVATTDVDGVAVTRVEFQGVPVLYGLLDDDSIIVTLGPDAISAYRGSTERLVDTAAFERAAEAVELGDTTSGFIYVDLDALIPLITDLSGPDTVPADARDVLGKLDSFILHSSTDENGMQVSGFVRVNK
ncbi:MAG: DUF3352 domain-containing protein [Gaiella sp.]